MLVIFVIIVYSSFNLKLSGMYVSVVEIIVKVTGYYSMCNL